MFPNVYKHVPYKLSTVVTLLVLTNVYHRLFLLIIRTVLNVCSFSTGRNTNWKPELRGPGVARRKKSVCNNQVGRGLRGEVHAMIEERFCRESDTLKTSGVRLTTFVGG